MGDMENLTCFECGETELLDPEKVEEINRWRLKHQACSQKRAALENQLAYRIVGILADAPTDQIRRGALDKTRSLLNLW